MPAAAAYSSLSVLFSVPLLSTSFFVFRVQPTNTHTRSSLLSLLPSFRRFFCLTVSPEMLVPPAGGSWEHWAPPSGSSGSTAGSAKVVYYRAEEVAVPRTG